MRWSRACFSTANNRAIGVEYLRGEKLYRAHAAPSAAARRVARRLSASREVILAGGAFNTPQLLMLSGIGPRETLERTAFRFAPISGRRQKPAGPVRNRRREPHEFQSLGGV